MIQKITKVLSLCIAALCMCSVFPFAKGQTTTVPSWLPTQQTVNGYNLGWQGNDSLENMFCSSATNLTAWAQLWVKNDSSGNILALIGQSYLDFGVNYLDQKISNTLLTEIKASDSNFTGSTYWDLIEEIMTSDGSIQSTNYVSQLPGWTHAIGFNESDSNDYLIIGSIGSKLILSWGFDTSDFDVADWNTLIADNFTIGMLFGETVLFTVEFLALLVSIYANYDSSITCPSSSAANVVPTTGSSTSIADLLAFNQIVGSIINPGGASNKSVPGYSIVATLFAAFITTALIIRKKHVTVQ
jgi:hypothetical protein